VALRQVLSEAPGSIRELARAAGLSHASLIQARDGEIGLRPETVRSIVEALRAWSTTCAALADHLEAAQRAETQKKEGAHE
jgi:hypothetical protein